MLYSIPSPGIRSINGVVGNGQDVSFVCPDGSVEISASTEPRTLEIRANLTSTGLVLENIVCDSSCYVSAAVYASEDGTVHAALANSTLTSNVIGFIESISGFYASIRVSGVSTSIFSGLDPSHTYYLSSTVPGGIATTVPTASGSVIAELGQPLSASRLVIDKKARMVRA